MATSHRAPERDAADELELDHGAVLPCDELNSVLVVDDPREGLWELVDSGWADQHLPELPALALEQDPIHRHKDVLAHTIAVVAQSPPRLRVRLGALFHDIGKPFDAPDRPGRRDVPQSRGCRRQADAQADAESWGTAQDHH